MGILEELFWFFIICMVVGAVLALFGVGDTEARDSKPDNEDPNVFYYEDLHGHDYDDD